MFSYDSLFSQGQNWIPVSTGMTEREPFILECIKKSKGLHEDPLTHPIEVSQFLYVGSIP